MYTEDQADNELRDILNDALRPVVEERLKSLNEQTEQLVRQHRDQERSLQGLESQAKVVEERLRGLDEQTETLSRQHHDQERNLQGLESQAKQVNESVDGLRFNYADQTRQLRLLRYIVIGSFLLAVGAIVITLTR